MEICFRDFSTTNWIHAFLTDSDENSISYIDISCYQWMCHLGIEDRTKEIKSNKFFMPVDDLIKKKEVRFSPYIPEGMFEYPVNEDDIYELNTLTDFFRKLHIYKGKLQYDDLEKAIQKTDFAFKNKNVMTKVVTYIVHHYFSTNERLRLLPYPNIISYYEDKKENL